MGILSPADDRSFKAGGIPLVAATRRDDYRKSWAKLVELVGALHKAGVTIVAGTDGQGIELVREIELYSDAGFTPAEALAGRDHRSGTQRRRGERTGSIAVGKEADLVLVDGDVSKRPRRASPRRRPWSATATSWTAMRCARRRGSAAGRNSQGRFERPDSLSAWSRMTAATVRPSQVSMIPRAPAPEPVGGVAGHFRDQLQAFGLAMLDGPLHQFAEPGRLRPAVELKHDPVEQHPQLGFLEDSVEARAGGNEAQPRDVREALPERRHRCSVPPPANPERKQEQQQYGGGDPGPRHGLALLELVPDLGEQLDLGRAGRRVVGLSHHLVRRADDQEDDEGEDQEVDHAR